MAHHLDPIKMNEGETGKNSVLKLGNEIGYDKENEDLIEIELDADDQILTENCFSDHESPSDPQFWDDLEKTTDFNMTDNDMIQLIQESLTQDIDNELQPPKSDLNLVLEKGEITDLPTNFADKLQSVVPYVTPEGKQGYNLLVFNKRDTNPIHVWQRTKN